MKGNGGNMASEKGGEGRLGTGTSPAQRKRGQEEMWQREEERSLNEDDTPSI